ncbi:MAG: MFS transporter [Acetobacter sp.]|uniref:spinster family MFS transporter n=1 Tax=Acetobacter sp. TaxID=440 RepID=UPI0039E77DEB
MKARSVITLFATAYVLSFVDRQILALLIGPVKADLGLSDFQFALLNGLAFALFYSVLGLPVAALADRMPRPPILAAGVALWSVATIGCGFSSNFWQLFFCRTCVGIGEAALVPAVYSFLADIVPPARLGRTLALFSLGSFVGAGLAFLCGGMLLAALHDATSWHGIAGWKLCFMAVGLPGLPLALCIALGVREPAGRTFGTGERPPAWAAARHMARHWKFFTLHFLGYSCTAIILFSLMSWTPALLGRGRHFSHQDVGLVMGLIAIVCGCGGVYTSGRLIDLLASRGHADAPARVGLTGAVAAPLFLLAALLMPGNTAFVLLLAVAFFFASFPMPPSALVVQQQVPKALRAQFSATLLLCNAMIGLSGGSMLIGYLDDHVFRTAGGVASSLGWVVAGAAVISGVCIAATRPYLRKAAV